jgi:hypothetical protein
MREGQRRILPAKRNNWLTVAEKAGNWQFAATDLLDMTGVAAAEASLLSVRVQSESQWKITSSRASTVGSEMNVSTPICSGELRMHVRGSRLGGWTTTPYFILRPL